MCRIAPRFFCLAISAARLLVTPELTRIENA